MSCEDKDENVRNSPPKQVWIEDNQIKSIEDPPPSYALAMFRESVNTVQRENSVNTIGRENSSVTIVSQPSINLSPHSLLAHQSSLESTDIVFTPRKHETMSRPTNLSQAWDEKVVIKDIHERDRMSLLCFCVSTISALITLTFYCTA